MLRPKCLVRCNQIYHRNWQGTALRNGNWAHQLHELLGQLIARLDDGSGLRTDAGTALAPHFLRDAHPKEELAATNKRLFLSPG
jgi:hypothetical protein